MRGYVPLPKDDTGIFDLRVPALCRRWVDSVDIRRIRAGSDGKGRGDATLKLVRTIACALNKLDPCPYHRVRRVHRVRDPLLLVQVKSRCGDEEVVCGKGGNQGSNLIFNTVIYFGPKQRGPSIQSTSMRKSAAEWSISRKGSILFELLQSTLHSIVTTCALSSTS